MSRYNYGRLFAKFAAAIVVFASICSNALAYPVLDAVKGLPNPELVTVYPDDADKNLYYFVPTSVELVRGNDGKPRLGVQYWGLTGLDPAGAGAALTFSVRPAYDKATVDTVAAALTKVNPNARYAFPTLVGSKMEVLLNGAFHAKKQDTDQPSSNTGGTVDATQGFAISLSDIGGRAFAQGVAADSDVLGAKYTFKFSGVEKRLRAKITVYTKRVYDHFKVNSTSSSWWGLVRTSWSADWQKLTNDGHIKLEILEGGETDKDAYMLEVFKLLVEAKIGETGMFAPKLKPGGISGAPESSNWGWGFSGGGGWEHLEEETKFEFVINTQKLADREFSVGLTFNAVCAQYPDNFADLTLVGNHCIDKAAYGQIAKAMRECVDAKLDRLLKLKTEGKISESVWEKQNEKAMDEVCIPEENVVAMFSPAATSTADYTKAICLDTQLSSLKTLLDAGEINNDTWERATIATLNGPCRSETSPRPATTFLSSALRNRTQ
ncbi:hypothetical protein ELG64_01050 [Rhizobium leguminosarum]|uniref:hypothetical protein n=1 Tax=Rhizobium leguminosarum TaxID=384 RepID=UPI00103122C2|nr:hypothetical protein [Rhizobium leguminosarum]TBH22191.1 hypothetical protein ELG64_01050 [Rhizobium leguminosarum]